MHVHQAPTGECAFLLLMLLHFLNGKKIMGCSARIAEIMFQDCEKNIRTVSGLIFTACQLPWVFPVCFSSHDNSPHGQPSESPKGGNLEHSALKIHS